MTGGSLAWQSVPSVGITGGGATDLLSGVSGYEHRTSTDGGTTWSPAAAGASAPVTAEGETLVQFRSIDGAGNMSAWAPGAAIAASTVRIDRTSPTVPSVSGGSLAWQSAASVSITASGASDSGSGPAGYQYRTSTNGGVTWLAPTAGAAAVVTAEGETLVQLRSIDGAGNVSAWAPAAPDATSTVRIDRSGPAASRGCSRRAARADARRRGEARTRTRSAAGLEPDGALRHPSRGPTFTHRMTSSRRDLKLFHALVRGCVHA